MPRTFLSLLLLSAFLLRADELSDLVANRVKSSRKAAGVVLVTISPEGRRVSAEGVARIGDTRPVDADSVFEIGSISKVFTSLLLADMIERGEVKPDTTVQSLLPATVKVPTRNDKQMTLLDLSLQVSGLPRMPDNFKPKSPENPYADYDTARLYDFLNRYDLPRDIGAKYEYSNVGVGLLGHALSRKAGQSYEALLQERIFTPLGMKSSTITLTDELKRRLAFGHSPTLQPVSGWDLDALAGAGAIRSTANDMALFLEAALGLKKTPLDAAFARMRSVSRETGTPELQIQMGWHRFTRFGTEIIWHNGGTGGYRTWAGFAPAKKLAAVALCNTSFSVDDLGLHALEPQWPAGMLPEFKVRKEVKLDRAVLERLVGEYQVSPTFALKVFLEGDQFFVQATGQRKLELFAENEKEFFLKVVDAQLVFGEGTVTLLQGGQRLLGKKVN
jgi:CubicO group peptidase (beta-lactamase class C family)